MSENVSDSPSPTRTATSTARSASSDVVHASTLAAATCASSRASISETTTRTSLETDPAAAAVSIERSDRDGDGDHRKSVLVASGLDASISSTTSAANAGSSASAESSSRINAHDDAPSCARSMISGSGSKTSGSIARVNCRVNARRVADDAFVVVPSTPTLAGAEAVRVTSVPPMHCSRSFRFKILPLAFVGSSWTTLTLAGTLYPLRVRRQCARMSPLGSLGRASSFTSPSPSPSPPGSRAAGRSVTTALTISPMTGCGVPKTAACATDGCACSALSTSAVYTAVVVGETRVRSAYGQRTGRKK
eukprot:31486-Pelagococcus_subviridis.AAC.5